LATKQSIVPFIKFWIASLALAKTAGYPGLCLRKRKQDVDHRESPVKMVVDKSAARVASSDDEEAPVVPIPPPRA
jgi:hypothetical protein